MKNYIGQHFKLLATNVLELFLHYQKNTFEAFVYTQLMVLGAWCLLPLSESFWDISNANFTCVQAKYYNNLISGIICIIGGSIGLISILYNLLSFRIYNLLFLTFFHIFSAIYVFYYSPISNLVPRFVILSIFCASSLLSLKRENKYILEVTKYGD